jgi:signal transduction histidine kinase
MPVAPSSRSIEDDQAESSLERKVAQEQLHLFSVHAPPTFATSAVASVLLTFLFWGMMSHVVLTCWLVFQVLVFLVRYLSLRAYTRLSAASVDVPEWQRNFKLGSFLTGLGWATGLILMHQVPSSEYQFIVILVITALSGASLGSLSIVPAAYPIYAYCLFVPVLLLNLQKANVLAYAIVVLGIIYFIALMSISRRIQAMVGDTLRLGIQNDLLRIQAVASSQAKGNFLSSVSHELRTPLTSIRGFASLIEREFVRSFAPQAATDAGLRKKADRIQDNLRIVLKESERLTRLINDVLDLAKIEAGRTDWHDTSLQVVDFIREAAEAANGMFASKPAVALQIEIEDKLPRFVGDADRMQQVLINLLNNAVKFTDTGAVTVKAFLNDEQQIQIDVRDTGIGFPAEDAKAIFDKFQQSRQGDTLQDRPKGTGLGLAIAQEIVNHHGGRIWAGSEPGHGSVFSLTLPPAPNRLMENQKPLSPAN